VYPPKSRSGCRRISQLFRRRQLPQRDSLIQALRYLGKKRHRCKLNAFFFSGWDFSNRFSRPRHSACHRSVQNRPVIIESKPATFTWPLIKFCKASSSKIPYVQGPFESILTFSIVSPFDFVQAWTRASLMDSIVTKNLRLRLLDPVELTIVRRRSSRSSLLF
jgi:hypothetical protein